MNSVHWDELTALYRAAPLGNKSADDLAIVFANSMFTTLVYGEGQLVATGRALADGLDCAYIGDVAVHPDLQGRGLGSAVVQRLVDAASGHKKIILYANPGTEGFYRRLGFLHMSTAMGRWQEPSPAIASGVLRGPG